MRIVDRATFLAMPPGTVFMKYESCSNFGDICFKGETVGSIDFWYARTDSIEWENSEELFDRMLAGEKDGRSMPMDFETEQRDGLYEKGQLFAVLEGGDISRLIDRLQSSLAAL